MKFKLVLSVFLIFIAQNFAFSQGDTSMEVTYIANEGFLISSGEKKILIDAVYQKTNPNYAAPSEDVLEKMKKGLPPFDDVDLLLATHFHHDHFDSNSVALFLKNNPETMFVSTEQTVEKVKKVNQIYPEIEHQIVKMKLDKDESTQITVNGIDLKIFRTAHSGDRYEYQNNIYLVKLGDKYILHEGDSNRRIETFEKLGLEKENINIAFAHGWFLFNEEGREILDKYFKPEHLILMHFRDIDLEEASKLAEEHKKYFENVTVFTDKMKPKIFN